MTKNHLKTLAVPRTWKLERKKTKYLARAYPGAHPVSDSMALSVVMRQLIKCVETRKEVKYILSSKNVLIDGHHVKEDKLPLGLMDVLTFTKTKESYRMIFDTLGHLKAIPVNGSEANMKPCKILGKTLLKGGKMQLNLADSRNIILDKNDYKIGDTVVISLPDQKVISHLPLEKGMLVYLLGGKHIGFVGKLEEIFGSKIKIKSKDELFETNKKYAFVIGKEKPVITLENK